MIVAKMGDEAESAFVAYEDDGAQHVILAIVAKQVDEAVYAPVVQTRKEVDEPVSVTVA